MRVFIAGASGLVGSNCLKHFREEGWEVEGSYFSFPQEGLHYYNTLDEADPQAWDAEAWKPDVIVHCGALTHVDYCEAHPDESWQKTVGSTNHLIALAQRTGARMVYLGTDYVFDGAEGPYREDHPTRPLSVYGRHKLDAETAVLSGVPGALVLRVTNVYGSEARGKNFVARIVQQAREGQPLTLKLPFDQYAHPTAAGDIARAAFLLLRDGHAGVFNIAGTDYMNRVELALRVLQYFPHAPYTLEAVSTASLSQPAPRPLNGGFIRQKFAALYPEFRFSNVDDFLRDGGPDGLS